MKLYVGIESQQQMDQLLDSIAGFHDSLTKEIHLVNRVYVREDKAVVYANTPSGAGFDAQVLIQSQWDPFAIELLFIGVRELYVGNSGVHWGAKGAIEVINSPVETRSVRMSFDSDLNVCSEKLFHRIRTEWLGAKSRLGSEIPCPGAVLSTRIEGRWRQCSSCCDAWEEDPGELFAYCPSCARLTELADG